MGHAMRITVITFGSRGDVQPMVALAAGLQQAGHQVVVACEHAFEALVRAHGLAFSPVTGDVEKMMQGSDGQQFVETGQNTVAMVRALAREVFPVLRDVLQDLRHATAGAELLLCAGIGFYPGASLAEEKAIPYIQCYLQPLLLTREFYSPLLPHPRWPLPGIANQLSHAVAGQSFWQVLRKGVNRLRTTEMGLPPWPFFGPFQEMLAQKRMQLMGWSEQIVPKPRDYPAFAHVTGYWFLDAEPAWTPDPALVDFLAAGPPPIYVGFGSMTRRDPRAAAQMVVAALQASGQRGILLRGWGGLAPDELPPSIHLIDGAPHDWLFPHMSAVVHHGGAGTTAAALRAGKPSLALPFFADQPFWGQRIATLGAGPAPIPQRAVTVETLAAAMRRLATDEALRRRAAALGSAIRAENGVARAVALITAAHPPIP